MPLRIIQVPGQPDEPDDAWLAPLARKARHVLATWPRGPAHEQSRRLLQRLDEARAAALRTNAPIADYLRAGFLGEIEVLADRLDELVRARQEALVRRARRFQGGSKPGRMDALSHTLRTVLEAHPRASGKEVWAELRRLAERKAPEHAVVRRLDWEGGILWWWPSPHEGLKKATRAAVFQRLTRVRKTFRATREA